MLDSKLLAQEIISSLGVGDSDDIIEYWEKIADVIVSHIQKNGLVTVLNVKSGPDQAQGKIA